MSIQRFTFPSGINCGGECIGSQNCHTLLAVPPRSLASIQSDQACIPDGTRHEDCHIVVNRSSQAHTLEQRVFPSGALAGSYDHMGQILSYAYRERDGVFAVYFFSPNLTPYLLWGDFDTGSRTANQICEAEVQNISIGIDDNFAVAYEEDLAIFKVTNGMLQQVAKTNASLMHYIRGMDWFGSTLMYAEKNGEVYKWDPRESHGGQAFQSHNDHAPVTKLITQGLELYVCAHSSYLPLSVWDIRWDRNPLRYLRTPGWTATQFFDVDVCANVAVGGASNAIWMWNCIHEGFPLGELRIQEPVREATLVGWRGRTGGIHIDAAESHYYIPFSGWPSHTSGTDENDPVQ